MNNIWNAFKVGFCKVEFLCYAREPNWLGWIIIGICGVVVFFFVFGMVVMLTEFIVKELLERLLGPHWYVLILSVILCLTLIVWVIVV